MSETDDEVNFVRKSSPDEYRKNKKLTDIKVKVGNIEMDAHRLVQCFFREQCLNIRQTKMEFRLCWSWYSICWVFSIHRKSGTSELELEEINYYYKKEYCVPHQIQNIIQLSKSFICASLSASSHTWRHLVFRIINCQPHSTAYFHSAFSNTNQFKPFSLYNT